MKHRYFHVLLSTWLLMSSLVVTTAHAQQTIQRLPSSDGRGIPYLEHLPSDYATSGQRYPLLIFLHGTGEQGDRSEQKAWKVASHGPPKHIQDGHDMTFTVDGRSFSFIVISPQLCYPTGSWTDDYVDQVVQHVLKTYRVDRSRMYLTGLSLGGGGVWRYGAALADQWAAVAPVCAAQSLDYGRARKIAKHDLPVWAFHGSADRTVSPVKTRSWVGLLDEYGANPKYTEYEGVGHAGAWQRAYRTDHEQHTPNLYEWLLQHQRGEEAPPPPKPTGSVAPDDIRIEAECGAVGSRWQTSSHSDASAGAYLVYPRGLSKQAPPSDPDDQIVYSLDVAQAGDYRLFARIHASSLGHNSLWFRVDDGDWVEWWEGMTVGPDFAWNLAPGGAYSLSAGTHTLTVAYREDGTRLDKLLLSVSDQLPDGTGSPVSCATDASARPTALRPLPSRSEASLATELSTYPSPANDHLTVRVPGGTTTDGVLTVLDLTGQQLSPTVLPSVNTHEGFRLDTQRVPPGVYLLRWQQHDQLHTAKVLVRH